MAILSLCAYHDLNLIAGGSGFGLGRVWVLGADRFDLLGVEAQIMEYQMKKCTQFFRAIPTSEPWFLLTLLSLIKTELLNLNYIYLCFVCSGVPSLILGKISWFWPCRSSAIHKLGPLYLYGDTAGWEEGHLAQVPEVLAVASAWLRK